MAFCTDCGHTLLAEAKFCTACGHPVAARTGAGPAGDPAESSPPTVQFAAVDAPEQPAERPGLSDGAPPAAPQEAPTAVDSETEADAPVTAPGPDPRSSDARNDTASPAPAPAPASIPPTGALPSAASAANVRSWFAPTAMTRPQVLEAARRGAIAFGVTLSVLVILVALVVLVAGGTHRGAPVDWFRTAVVLMGLGVHAPVDVDVLIMRGSLSVMPLLVTAIEVGAVAWLWRRAERARPTAAPAGTRVPQLLVTGVVFGVLLAVFAAAAAGPLGYGGDDMMSVNGMVRVGVSPFFAFLAGTAVATVAAAVGWLLADGGTRSASLGALPTASQDWRRHLRTARDLVVATLIVGVLSAVLLALRAGASPERAVDNAVGSSTGDAMGWWPALVMAPNLLVAASGFGMGGSLAVDAAATVREATPLSYAAGIGLLAGHAPVDVLLICLILMLCAAVIVGVRSALWRSPVAPLASRWWQPAVVCALVWGVLAWSTRISGHASGALDSLGPIFGGGTADGGGWLGLGLPSTMLMAALWAALAAAVGTWVALVVGGSRPGWFVRLAGQHLHPEWAVLLADAGLRRGEQPHARVAAVADELRSGRRTPPAKPLAVDRRRDRRLGMGLGGALAVALLGLIGHAVAQATVFTPERVVASYLDAVGGRDAAAALSHVSASSVPQGQNPLLSDAAMGVVPAHTVESVDDDSEAYRTVQVTFTTDAGSVRRSFNVTQEGRAWGLFDDWKVVDPFSRVQVNGMSGTTSGVHVGKVTLPEEVSEAVAFPGVYEVSADAQPGYDTPRTTLTALDAAPSAVTLEAKISQQTQQAANLAVKKYVDSCAAQTVTTATGCPFELDENSFLTTASTTVKRTVQSYPVVEVRRGIDGALSVSATQPGKATKVLQGGTTPSTPEQVTYTVSGELNWDGKDPSTATLTHR